MEEWKQIPEFPDNKISNLARIKNKHGKIRKSRGKIPIIDFWAGKKRATLHVAKLYYRVFIGEIGDNEHLVYLDGNPLNITKENLMTQKQRRLDIIEMYKNKQSLISIANKYKLSVKTIQSVLWNATLSLAKEKPFTLPNHNSKGKIELATIPAEYHIPYADNCTVRPKIFNHEQYLIKQSPYNY